MLRYLVVLFFALPTYAHIPEAQTILNRAVKFHGKGTYQLQQEVQVASDVEYLVINETWTVKDGDQMHLLARLQTTPPQQIEYVYSNGRRHYRDGANIKSEAYSSDFVEPFFHFRSFASMAHALVNAQMSNQKIFQKKTFLRGKDLSTFQYEPENFVHLTRTQGVVAYGFSLAPMEVAKVVPTDPALWIEQDSFLVRKILFRSGLQVMADEYGDYPNELKFPQVRTVVMGPLRATMKLKNLRLTAESPAQLQVAKLAPPLPLNLSATQTDLINFYKRTR